MTPEEIEKKLAISNQSVVSLSSPKTFRNYIKHKIFILFQNISSGFKFGIGFALALGTAGVLAVAVTGTFNTFSSGSLLKSADINANFATLKTAIESIPSQPAMRLIYETDVTSATTSINITGLNGNADVQYQVISRIVGGGSAHFYIRPNNDSNASNYGSQFLYGSNTLASAARNSSEPGLYLGDTNIAGASSFSFGIIYAKTGLARMFQNYTTNPVTGTSVLFTQIYSTVWNDTISNITSFTVYADQASGIGAGSHIEIWARR